MLTVKTALTALFSVMFMAAVTAQDQRPAFQYKNGIGVTAPDSSFSVNFRFRIQNRVGFTITDNDTAWTPSAVEFRTRRARMRVDGFVFNKRWQYALQLSFSRADQDWDNAGVPNVLRDAMIFYEVNKNLRFGFGQGKLPGNRQRVVSSGEQQFVDRSNVNATFNIDRDFGLQLYYHFNTGNLAYNLRGAVSSGEGRNEGVSRPAVPANTGLCYTGRFEILPFGDFSSKSDYFEADLAREPKPKLSLAGGLSVNDNAIRSGGQLGRTLYEMRDMNTLIFDGLFKFRGLSLYGEYIHRLVAGEASPITISEDGSDFVYEGEGILAQSGFVFGNNYEVVARFAQVLPLNDTRLYRDIVQDYTIGFNKYFKQHRLKCQFDATLQQMLDPATRNETGRNLQFRFQVELGI